MNHLLPSWPLACLLLAATLLASPLCASAQESRANANDAIRCTVGAQGGEPIDGLGVELDPHFLSANAAAGIGVKESDWDNVVVPRLRDLAFSKWRVMVLPWWYEPENDNDNPMLARPSGFTFESPEMRGLYRQLDLAQQDSIPVCLVFWGVRPGTFMLPEEANGWVFGPSEYEEWAENICVCLHHLFSLGYTCIREVTPVNEPDWSFTEGSVSRIERYVQMCHVLDRRLKAEGLRKRVLLTLSDDSDGGTGHHTFLRDAVRLLPEADLFCSHTYLFGYDTPNDSITGWERTNVQLAAQRGKRHFVGEFGSNQTVGSTRQRDINLPERGVLMGRIVIGLLNGGATGASYWSLMDQYYSLGEAQGHHNMPQLGLWKHLQQEYPCDSTQDCLSAADYALRPQYHALRLLSHAVQSGSVVFPIHTGHPMVAATALWSAQGRWTYLLANPTSLPHVISISNPHLRGKKKFLLHSYLSDDFLQSVSQPSGTTTLKSRHGQVTILLPPRSLLSVSEPPSSPARH